MTIFAIAYLLLTPLYMLHPRIARLARAGHLKREWIIAVLVLVMSVVETVLNPFVSRHITAPIEIIYSIMGLYLFMRICKMADKVHHSIMSGEYDE